MNSMLEKIVQKIKGCLNIFTKYFQKYRKLLTNKTKY